MEDSMPRYTTEDLKRLTAEGKSRTDIARVKALTEEELEESIRNDPDWADVADYPERPK
jgi:hypothetical protein